MADYTITNVRQTSELSPTGQLQDVVEATYELAGGAGTGTVRVPKTGNWADALQAQVATEAEAMAGLLG